jgi:hypothetical protein
MIRDLGFNSQQGLEFFSSPLHPDWLWGLYPLGTRISFCGDKVAQSVKLIIHLHLVPRSRMFGAISPLPHYALMVWCSVKAQEQLYLYLYSSARILSFLNCKYRLPETCIQKKQLD